MALNVVSKINTLIKSLYRKNKFGLFILLRNWSVGFSKSAFMIAAYIFSCFVPQDLCVLLADHPKVVTRLRRDGESEQQSFRIVAIHYDKGN